MNTQTSRDWAKQILAKYKAKHGGRLPEPREMSHDEMRKMILESYPDASEDEVADLIIWITQS